MKPGLVIFDCDGVLVDTERMANRTMAAIVTDLGYPMTGPQCQQQFMGRTLENVQELVEELTGRTLPPDWPDQVRDRDLEAFKAGVDAIDGIEAVLDDLNRREVPYCVASSGKYRKMHTTLGSSGLLPRLSDRLFSAEDCEKGKPAPDVFLLAARTMGHRPESCAVVEDSVPGVLAARAAGMRAFAFVEDPACDRDAMRAAGAVLFEAMAELPDLLFSKT
ncbi:HAD family hydrolase [Roseibium marinum]|uniref:HAD superfamily hydrolase (TIGR01509 family) n=1 Tax=Roseibium marinum TaxID=281252 RepID=A0A2S3UZF3_9HYPH|nr:HAD-IA family hydrolase [Roseibium marinum]POF32990.1 HAD superfamily hydrolase (TIGR01509 family) [Roseibium marinum]